MTCLILGNIFAMPKTVKDANDGFPSRLGGVLRWFNDNKKTPGSQGWVDFGDWKTNAPNWTLRKMGAGLEAIATNQSFQPDLATFPAAVETWLSTNAYQYSSVGTDAGG